MTTGLLKRPRFPCPFVNPKLVVDEGSIVWAYMVEISARSVRVGREGESTEVSQLSLCHSMMPSRPDSVAISHEACDLAIPCATLSIAAGCTASCLCQRGEQVHSHTSLSSNEQSGCSPSFPFVLHHVHPPSQSPLSARLCLFRFILSRLSSSSCFRYHVQRCKTLHAQAVCLPC